MSLLAEIIQKENITSFDKDTFDGYVQKLKDIKFDDIEAYPMTTKGKNLLYNTISLAVFPSDDPNDERKKKLQELA